MVEVLPTLPISLTGVEVIHLIDSLRNGATLKEIEDEPGYLRDLVLKLSSLYRELVGAEIKPGPASIEVTEPQVWLMRAKVRSGDVGIDKSMIGVALSNKLYALLNSFASGFSDYDTIEDDELAHIIKPAEEASERVESHPDSDQGTADKS